MRLGWDQEKQSNWKSLDNGTDLSSVGKEGCCWVVNKPVIFCANLGGKR